MKKTLIAVAAAAALTATSAFAEITFGAWLRVLGSPIASTGEETVAGMENSWGWGARTARINVNGVSEDGKAGFVMGVYNDFENGLDQGDNAYLWVKPVDQVKVSFGKLDGAENGLRGDFCYGSWNWIRPFNWGYDGEGLTFDGIWRKGLMIEADPIEGLHAFAVIPMSASYQKAEDVYKNIQVGFGYAIEGVGKFKAQYIGDFKKNKKADEKTTYGWANYTNDDGDRELNTEKATLPSWDAVDSTDAVDNDDTVTTGQIGIAFDLTAVENLYVTVGARFGIADKDYEDGAKYIKMAFTAGASYQVTEQFKVSVDGGYIQYQDDCVGKEDDLKDNKFFVGAGVDYALMDGLNAVADVRYMSIGYGKDGDDGAVSFLVGLNKSVSSNGSLGIGFQGATNGCGLAAGDKTGLVAGYDPSEKDVTGDGDEFVWAIPVSISVWF
ncbi:outer membrane beta-barrel protein [Treponema sp.]|uniref:outer membrane beta-barrel protein n=1 Tax=Treponema sp. TaxID=166 RepID=UPI003F1067ED